MPAQVGVRRTGAWPNGSAYVAAAGEPVVMQSVEAFAVVAGVELDFGTVRQLSASVNGFVAGFVSNYLARGGVKEIATDGITRTSLHLYLY